MKSLVKIILCASILLTATHSFAAFEIVSVNRRSYNIERDPTLKALLLMLEAEVFPDLEAEVRDLINEYFLTQNEGAPFRQVIAPLNTGMARLSLERLRILTQINEASGSGNLAGIPDLSAQAEQLLTQFKALRTQKNLILAPRVAAHTALNQLQGSCLQLFKYVFEQAAFSLHKQNPSNRRETELTIYEQANRTFADTSERLARNGRGDLAKFAMALDGLLKGHILRLIAAGAVVVSSSRAELQSQREGLRRNTLDTMNNNTSQYREKWGITGLFSVTALFLTYFGFEQNEAAEQMLLAASVLGSTAVALGSYVSLRGNLARYREAERFLDTVSDPHEITADRLVEFLRTPDKLARFRETVGFANVASLAYAVELLRPHASANSPLELFVDRLITKQGLCGSAKARTDATPL